MITLVAGPPAAGKTTYVAQRAQPGDMVLDWDVILSALTGLAVYERPELVTYYANVTVKRVVLALKWAMLHGRPVPDTWVIRTAPKRAQRWVYSLDPPGGLGAAVVVLPTSAEICHARIDADPARLPAALEQHAAVDEWWAAYEPDQS
jgi:hypothetical protein